MTLVKPDPWPWNPTQTAMPALASDATCVIPTWEGTGNVKELVSGNAYKLRGGGATWATQEGMPVIRYDGNGYIELPPVIGTSQVYTVLLVLRTPISAPAADSYMGVYKELNAGGDYAVVSLATAAGATAAAPDVDHWREADGTELYITGAAQDFAGLHTLIVRRNHTALALSYDGERIDNQPPENADDVTITPTVAFVGRDAGDGFTGDIGFFACWGSARSDQEIADLGTDPFGIIRQAGSASRSRRSHQKKHR